MNDEAPGVSLLGDISLFIFYFFEGMNTFIHYIIWLSGESRTGSSSLFKMA